MKNSARFSCWTGPEMRMPSGDCALPKPASESIINGEIETAASNDQRMNTPMESRIGCAESSTARWLGLELPVTEFRPAREKVRKLYSHRPQLFFPWRPRRFVIGRSRAGPVIPRIQGDPVLCVAPYRRSSDRSAAQAMTERRVDGDGKAASSALELQA